jgi:hypothetical protein
LEEDGVKESVIVLVSERVVTNNKGELFAGTHDDAGANGESIRDRRLEFFRES